MQEVCLRLMGKKLLVALAMEGKFTADGLQGIDGDDDMLTAMARELVEHRGIGETADSVWRSVGQLQPSTTAPMVEEPCVPVVAENDDTPVPAFADLPATPNDDGACRPSASRISPTGQLSLF